jgi:hypothetical protein
MNARSKIDGVRFVIGDTFLILVDEKVEHSVAAIFDYIIARASYFESNRAVFFNKRKVSSFIAWQDFASAIHYPSGL